MEAGNLPGWRPREEADVVVQVQKTAGRIPSYSRKVSLLFWQTFRRLDEATHVVEDNPIYSESISLNINHIQKHLHRNIQNDVWPNIWAAWPRQVDGEINDYMALVGIDPGLA